MIRVAIIDIGTVTCRLAVSDIEDNKVIRMIKHSTICNLGEGLSGTGKLSSEAIARVEACCKEYIQLILAAGANRVACTLTEAARAATNGNTLLMRLSGLGLKPQVIEGSTEGSLTFLGVAQNAANQRILVADNGGGSTELTLGRYSENKLEIEQVLSTKLGCRTLSERFGLSATEHGGPSVSAIASAKHEIQAVLAGTFLKDLSKDELSSLQLYVCGGTATSLSAILQKLIPYDPKRVHLSKLEAGSVSSLVEHMAKLSYPELLALPSLQPQRAPVIFAGSLIVSGLLSACKQEAAIVSESDLLVGLSLCAAAACTHDSASMPYTPVLAHIRA